MYAIDGNASPTINSQGNQYTALADPNAKEVMKRLETNENNWVDWNWRSGDIMINGAFFMPSRSGVNAQYTKASSKKPKAAIQIDQLTIYSGVFDDSRDNGDVFPGFIEMGPQTGYHYSPY